MLSESNVPLEKMICQGHIQILNIIILKLRIQNSQPTSEHHCIFINLNKI